MYDTVNLWMNGVDVPGGNPFGILPHLSEITERQNEKDGYSCTGKVLDYTVHVFRSGISLKGSLCKSFFGDNLQTLKRSTVKQAIGKLNDCLHTDISAAKVTRADIATVIPTRRQPADYYPYMGQKPYFQRLQSTYDTLYYNNRQRQIIFYDKTKEANAKKVIIPAIWQNCNLFRYELRYNKSINRQLKADVRASTLYDDTFYSGVIQNWHNEFKTIQKLKNQRIMVDDITTLKGAKEALFAALLQEKGQGFIDDIMRDLRAANRFNSRSDYTKLRADLNKMLVSKNGNNTDLMQELETAIYNIARYAR